MHDILAKQEYLYQNQIERVIFEDLPVAAEFRKPEMLRRFYLGVLAEPGRETNVSKLSKDIGITAATITNYFPLQEATDLVWRLHKYTGSKATAKAQLQELSGRSGGAQCSHEAHTGAFDGG